MTNYQIYTRIRHFFMARHWRGAAIHSPMMYAFVREYALKYRGEAMIKAIGAPVIEDVNSLMTSTNNNSIVILREPFRDRDQRALFEKWYTDNHSVVAHFQGLIVIFFDKKLQKQRYLIRN